MTSSINASTSGGGGIIQTADSSGILALQTGGTTAMTIDASQNVGVGVTPTSGWFSTYKVMQLGTYGNWFTNNDHVTWSNNQFVDSAGVDKYANSDYATMYRQVNGQHYWYNAPSGTAGNAISFTQAMTLDANGNLSVGTTSAADGSSRVTISGTSTVLLDASGSLLRFNKTAGTDTGWLSNRSYSWHDGNGLALSTQTADSLKFGTNSTERARIDSSGNLLVGTTSGSFNYISKSNSGSYVLQVTNTNYGSGDGVLIVKGGNGSSGPYLISCESNAASVFRVYGNGTYGTVSDVNLKKNIETSRGYLDDLLQLRVVKYNWNTQEDGDAKELGFIAQEVEAVFPALVENSARDGEATNKLIKQPVLIPMLVKAIQEQQALITTLTERITALEGAQQ
jgi:hypothetical protein